MKMRAAEIFSNKFGEGTRGGSLNPSDTFSNIRDNGHKLKSNLTAHKCLAIFLDRNLSLSGI